MKGKKKNIKLLTKGKQWNSLVLDTLFEVIKISIKRQGQRFLGRRFHSIFYGWRQTSTEAQQMQNANGKEERKKNKHLFQTPSHEGLGKAEPVLRKSKALLNPAGNKKQPKRKQWQAQWGCCLCSRYELLECQHSDTQPEWWQPHVTTAQLFPCRKAKFHCLSSPQPHLGQAQRLRSQTQRRALLSHSVNPFPVLTMTRFVPQSQHRAKPVGELLCQQ